MLQRDKLQQILDSFDELTQRLSDPAVLGDQKEYTRLAREQSKQTPMAEKVREYLAVMDDIDSAREMVRDESEAEMREFALAEVRELEARVEPLEDEIKLMMLPGDPADDRDIIIEIRAGAGGDEAAIFAGDLYRMYTRYADLQKWKHEDIDASESETGGYKEVSFRVRGKRVYSKMKFESGVHRVQRVPVTESQGRIHTSTATVAVLPEADEVEVEVSPQDIRIDVFRATGPGGQSVNTTDSAVRVTHLTTGIVISCQDEKSQLQNKTKAMAILRARLYQMEQERLASERSEARRGQIGSGERSEKIRTYNYPQNRVTDHRIGKTVYNLAAVLEGDLDEFIEELAASEQAEKLQVIDED